MKSITLILSIVIFSFLNCEAKTPPAAVSKAFAQKFKSAEKVKWDTEGANEWEAEFRFSGKEMSSSFNPTGKWLETETAIEKSEIPSAIKSALVKEFAGAKIGEASLLESPEFNGYEIELKYQGKNYEVQATKDGKIHKKAEAKDND